MNIFNLSGKTVEWIHSTSGFANAVLLLLVVLFAYFLQMDPAQQTLAGGIAAGLLAGFVIGYTKARLV